MKYNLFIIDKSLLYLVGNALFFYFGELTLSILLTLLVLFLASISTYLKKTTLSTILFFALCLTCLYFPLLSLFIPLFIFDVYTTTHKAFSLITFIPWSSVLFSEQYLLLILSVSLTFLGILLSSRSHRATQMHNQYNQLLDQTRETQLNHERKNKELMDKQDYELNLATLKERNRIARDLHDSIGHVLTSSILQAGAIHTISNEPETQKAVEILQESLSCGMNDVRQSIHNLYDQSIDLKDGILKQIERFDFAPVDFKFNITHPPEQHITYAILFILKEGLSNITRHSDADRVRLVVHEHTGFYQFILRDNGKNASKSIENNPNRSGIGLSNIASRVEALNGNVNFNQQNGFEIFATLPKESK